MKTGIGLYDLSESKGEEELLRRAGGSRTNK